MKRILMIAFSALVLAACAPQQGAPLSDAAREYKSIAAPSRDDVTVEITAAHNGGTVDVKTGDVISVALRGVPTAGYLWAVAEAPAFLEADGEAGGATSEAQFEPGFAGGRHWEVFFFKVTGAGSGVLKLEQRRPWEEDEPPAGEFSVTINAVG